MRAGVGSPPAPSVVLVRGPSAGPRGTRSPSCTPQRGCRRRPPRRRSPCSGREHLTHVCGVRVNSAHQEAGCGVGASPCARVRAPSRRPLPRHLDFAPSRFTDLGLGEFESLGPAVLVDHYRLPRSVTSDLASAANSALSETQKLRTSATRRLRDSERRRTRSPRPQTTAWGGRKRRGGSADTGRLQDRCTRSDRTR